MNGFPISPCNRQRGSALNELVICLLPYLLVILAAIFFWHLLLGKQEAIKYATSNAMPGSGTINKDIFFGKLDGTSEMNTTVEYNFAGGTSEAMFNTAANVEEADEPVLPYNTDGSDLKRAIEFSGQQIIYDPNTKKFRLHRGGNSTGGRLENLGFLNEIDPNATFDSASDIKIEVLDTELLAQVAKALGEWITYHSASANYSYAVPFGQEALVLENDAPTGQHWRSKEGVSAFKTAPAAFWPVVEDPAMRAWTNLSGLSSALNEVFSLRPAALISCGFSSTGVSQYDKGSIGQSE